MGKMQLELKQCTTCRRVKQVTAFHRHRGGKDGLQGCCKECRTAYNQAHREEAAVYKRAWREAHREERRVSKRNWYKAHQEEQAVYREVHREKQAAYMRVWREAHREEKAAYDRVWRKANPEKNLARDHRRRARIAGAAIGRIDYKAIKKRDRMLCCVCGKRVRERDLSFDHSIPISLGGPHTQKNLRVCHRRCNSSRGPGRLPVQMVLV